MADDEQTGGQQYDAPNQQAVGGAHPSEEGTGGSGGAARTDKPSQVEGARRTDADTDDLDAMTKAQLHAYADESGVQVNDEMTKAEMREAIERANT